MNCPKCGIGVIPGTRFCSNCGAPLPEMTDEEIRAEKARMAGAAASASEAGATAAGAAASASAGAASSAGASAASAQSPQQSQQSQQSQPGKRIIELPIEYKPISAWGYFGYNVLFAIPIVGLVFMLIYALGGTKNKNLKNFARSQFIWLLILIVFSIVFVIFYALQWGTLG